MAIKKSKISAMWRLEVLSVADDSVLRTYSFPDTFLDNFFDAANGFACRPLGRLGETSIKWGYGTAPVTFSDKRLQIPATLPARYDGALEKDRRWPVWTSSGFTSQVVNDPNLGNVTSWSCGTTSYDPETRTVIKQTGGVDTTPGELDLNGNPMHGAWFEIMHTEVTGPITEFGTAVRYSYYNTGWLDNTNKPLLITSEDPWEANETSRPGLDYFSGAMFNFSPAVNTRALVLDGDGNPTSITLVAGEKLRVSREITLEFTLFESASGQITVSINGTPQTTTLSQEVPTPDASDLSFWKLAPVEDILALQNVLNYAFNGIEYRSSDNNVLGRSFTIPGWDEQTSTWKSFKFRTTSVEDQNSDQLDITAAAVKNIKRIVVHDGISLLRPPIMASTPMTILTYSFEPAIDLSGLDGIAFNYGYDFKRYVSRA